jgi:dCTP diphosphatase
MQDSLHALTQRILAIRDARDWKQFHNPKDLALSLVLEATELLELFQWKNGSELQEHLIKHKSELGDELSDVLYWVLLLSHDLGIDLPAAFEAKMQKNEAKYPVDKARGTHTKYTNL